MIGSLNDVKCYKQTRLSTLPLRSNAIFCFGLFSAYEALLLVQKPMHVQPGSSYQNEHVFLFSQSCAKLKLTVNRMFNSIPRLAPGARFTARSDWFLAVFRDAVIG